MKNFKGTPGPWEIIEHSWSDTSLVSGDKTIATVSIYEEATEENQEKLESEVSANFKLLSKAPEMYDILFRLSVDEHVDIEEIDKLVKQATEL